MTSMNTRLNIEKLNENIVQKHRGSKQVGFKQLGLGVEKGVHGVHDEKCVWFEVKLQGAQGDREDEVFQVSNDDTAVAQIRLEDKQPEEKTNTDCLRSTQQCMKSMVAKHLGVDGIQQQNRLVDETNVTLFSKVHCFLIQSSLSKVFWADESTRSTYLVNRSPSSAIGFKKPMDMLGNMSFNKSGEYKKTFIGSGVAHDREQHLACELFGYREDSNEAAFAVAVVEKIYAHNQMCICSAMVARKAVTTATTITSSMHQGHSTLSLEDSLSGDCDVETNGKWSCIYAVGNQEYQMVCTRLDITSADVGMLDKFDRGLQIDVQVFVNFDYAMGKSITVMGLKEGNMAKGTLERVKIAKATSALVKGGSQSKVPAQVEIVAYWY
ncbi:hypothetical protein Tco_0741048 [Tanacetum coccineum]